MFILSKIKENCTIKDELIIYDWRETCGLEKLEMSKEQREPKKQKTEEEILFYIAKEEQELEASKQNVKKTQEDLKKIEEEEERKRKELNQKSEELKKKEKALQEYKEELQRIRNQKEFEQNMGKLENTPNDPIISPNPTFITISSGFENQQPTQLEITFKTPDFNPVSPFMEETKIPKEDH